MMTTLASAETPGAREQAVVPQRLLAAARRLFADNGFDRTSVQDIVAAAGVTKGAMYHYFDSKDELLYRIYARVLEDQSRRLSAIIAEPGTPTQRLRAAAEDVVLTSIANLDDSKIFFRSIHHLSPERQRTVRQDRRRYHRSFKSLVDEGQASGEFRDDVSADLVMNGFFGSVHHLGQWYRPSGRLAAGTVATEFAKLLVASLAPQ